MNPDDYSEMICSGCTSKLSFLPAYKHLIGKILFLLKWSIATNSFVPYGTVGNTLLCYLIVITDCWCDNVLAMHDLHMVFSAI